MLSHEDVKLIDLVPVTESNGKVVYRQLEAATPRTAFPSRSRATPAAICIAASSCSAAASEHGVALRRQTQDGVPVETCPGRDASWQPFVENVHRFKQQVSQTDLAGLAPP